MALVARVEPIWLGKTCLVAGTGPGLTAEVAQQCYQVRTVAVNDAYRLMPWADVLYACDAAWWRSHVGAEGFSGQRWSSHSLEKDCKDNKIEVAAEYDLNIVNARRIKGFSCDARFIHYGDNSGFQAMNLAIHFGVRRMLLVGFNMWNPNNRRHFFGDHQGGLRNGDPRAFLTHFNHAAQSLPAGLEIINCTPNSKLTCFRQMSLEEALALPLPL